MVNTMGIVEVACINEGIADPDETMTSTFKRTNSAATSARRSGRPSHHRYSIAIVLPAIQPSSRIRATKAAVQVVQLVASVPRNPMVGNFGGCAPAAIGHDTAPPTSVMNSRRRIGFSATPRITEQV